MLYNFGLLFVILTLSCAQISSQELLVDFDDENYVWGVVQGNEVELADEQDILQYELNNLTGNASIEMIDLKYKEGYIIYQIKRTSDHQILKTRAISVVNSSNEGERPECRNGVSHTCDGNCPSNFPETYCESCAFTRDACNNITGCKCNTYGCCVHTITSDAKADMNLSDNIQEYEE